jgi:hypothetical protein
VYDTVPQTYGIILSGIFAVPSITVPFPALSGQTDTRPAGSHSLKKSFSESGVFSSITPPIPSEWMGLAEEMTISSL